MFCSSVTPALTDTFEGTLAGSLPTSIQYLERLVAEVSGDGIRLVLIAFQDLEVRVSGLAESERLVESILANLRESSYFSDPETEALVPGPDGIGFRLHCKVRL